MNVYTRWKRSATALVAVVPLAIGMAQATASATPVRTATTYTDTTYLQDALGLPAGSTPIETVTYDRFQWLLGQPGNFAFLIGDPSDANFSDRAKDVDAAAKAANVAKVYWFDPNLSANAKVVGNNAEPNLDIRQPAGIASLTAASQTVYGYAWTNLIAQYLGNGYNLGSGIVSPIGVGAQEGGTIKTVVDDTNLNDYGSNAGYSTKVGDVNGGALYGYTAGVDATVAHDFFFIYNKARTVTPVATPKPAKIVSWVDLSAETTSPGTKADVTTAVGTVGAASITQLSQGAWWKDEVNAKYQGSQPTPALNPSANNGAPGSNDVLSATDSADWRIQQITYPQLVHLLNGATTQNAIILFGGTWCPNTRAVLQSVNQYAIENDVPVVYNFDTVLDGGWVGGGTTSATDPLQTRNYASSTGSSDTANSNPSFLYGDLVSNYLANIATEYDPTIGSGFVNYYPLGNNAKALKSVRKLQVPFLIGYQKGASSNPYNNGTYGATNGGVTRQWIQQHTDVNGLPNFTEYMSEPYDTHPQPYGLALKIPHDAAIWSTINSDLSTFTWQSDPAATSLTSHYNTATDADDASYLSAAEVATFNYTSTGAGTVSAAVANPGTSLSPITPGVTGASVLSISPSALTAAQAALGASNPATKAAAQTALLAAEKAVSPDATLVGNLATVFSAYSVAQSRKTSILSTWSSVQFGLEATAKASKFFGGLPGGVVSTQTVTADSVSYGTAPTVNVAIANDYGRVPTGSVSLSVTGGPTAVAPAAVAVAQNAASFTLPKLAPGTYNYSLSFPGDDQILAFTKTGSLTVAKANATGIAVAVTTAPTSVKPGSYKVSVATPSGLAAATGQVTLNLVSGSSTKTFTGGLSGGVADIAVPNLAAGTWAATASWPGDANYAAASPTTVSTNVWRRHR